MGTKELITLNIGYETEVTEFKKSTGELKEGVISLASMLNKHSAGTVYFGVKNNGDIIGQEIGDRTLRDISQMIATSIKPQIIPTITLELMENYNVIKVEAQGSEKPYSVFGRYYIRSADEDRELSPIELKRMMREQESSDIIITQPAGNQSLTFAQLKTLFATKGLTVNENSFEQNLGFYNKNNQYNLMAELLADKNDVSVKVVTFRGKDKSEIIKRNEYGFKCLALSMDQVLSYMEAINDTKVVLGSHQREEEKLFDFPAFKEAWQNACLHTKWSKMNPPAVYIFSDRIEIISTGGLADGLTKEEFFKGISKPVNAKLQKIFGQLGYVEQTGHGIPLIIAKYGIQAFDITDNFVNVIIPFNKNISNTTTEAPIELNEAQSKIFNYLKEHPKATIKVLVSKFDFSDGYVRKIIAFLKDNGYIKHEGSNKTGFWMILK